MFVTKAFFHVFILQFVLTNYLVNLTLVLSSLYYFPIHLVKCACFFFILRKLPIRCFLRDRKKSTHWLELPLKHIGCAFLIILGVTLRFQARAPG